MVFPNGSHAGIMQLFALNLTLIKISLSLINPESVSPDDTH